VAGFPVAGPLQAAASRPARDNNTEREAPELRRPPRPERLADRRPLRPLPRTVRRPSKAVRRLRRRIRPSASNPRIKTSRSAKKDTLPGLTRARRVTQIGRKRGSKPRSPTTAEDITRHRLGITTTITGTMAKSPPWQSARPRWARWEATRPASQHPRQQQPPRQSSMRRRHRVPEVCLALPTPPWLTA